MNNCKKTTEKKVLSLDQIQEKLFEVLKIVDKFCNENGIKYYIIGGTLLGAIRHQDFIPWDDDIDIAMEREEYERFISISNQLNSEIYEVSNYRTKKEVNFSLTRIFINDTEIEYPKKSLKVDTRLYFDIFPLDYAPKDIKKQKKQSKMLNIYKKLLSLREGTYYKNNIFYISCKFFLSLIISIVYGSSLPRKMDKEMKKYSKEKSDFLCSMASQYSYERQKMYKGIYGEPRGYLFRDKYFYGPEDYDTYLKKIYGNDYMSLPPIEKRRKGMTVYEIYKKDL